MAAKHQTLSGDLSPYQVNSRREIIVLLRSISQHKQMINMLANQGAVAIVTSILDVDDSTGEVIIDCAQRDRVNAQLLASDNISFETTLEQVRILFFANQVTECTYDGAPALKIMLPASLIRLQRREFYRVLTPLTNPVSCTITIPGIGAGEPHEHTMVLQNVSGSGIALIDEFSILGDTIGRVYHNCRIDLPGGSLVVASLELRNAHQIQLANGKTVRRLGCLFVDMPHAMLAAIQRYISRLEREQNARAAGRSL